MLTGVTFILGAVALFFLLLSHLPAWRLLVLGWVVLLLLTAAWLRWEPVKRPGGRRWFVVAENGLLVWSPKSTDLVTIPWTTARVERRMVRPQAATLRLVWQHDGQERGFDLPEMFGRGALIRAVERRGPVPRWSPQQVAGTTAVASAAALMLWFAAVPVALDLVFGERPDDITDFERICEGGDPFGRAAPYRGSGPHPVALYGEDSTGYPDYILGLEWAGTVWPQADDAQDVQLVGCAQLTSRATPDPIETCHYEGGYTLSIYQGRYRVEVYEARTGDRVSSFTIDGPVTSDGCSPKKFVADGGPLEDSYETSPDDGAYTALLSPLVNGEVVDN